jgi:putative PIN family toxin of toxin-antitoxin system
VIRAVLDANVLAPAFANPTATAGRLVALWHAGGFELVVSDHVLAELRRTYADPYYSRRLTPQQVDGAVALLRAEAIHTPISVSVTGVATHPEDDLVLATGLSAGADYLCTRDRQLLKLGTHGGMGIVGPGELLAILRPDEDDAPRSLPEIP